MTSARRLAALACLAAGFATSGCSDGDEQPASSAPDSTVLDDAIGPESTVGPTTVAATPLPDLTAPDTTPAAPPATDPPTPTAADVLAAALRTTAAGYHFTTTVRVGDEVALSAEGDHLAGGTRMTVTSGDASIEYVIAEGQAWVAQDGEWSELDEPTVTDPLAALGTPASVRDLPDGGRLEATYPGSALGLESADPVPVVFELADGRIATITYRTESGGTEATVVAVLGPPASETPVTIPGT